MAHRTLALLVLVFGVNYMDRQLLAIFLEPMKRDLGLSDTQMALLYGFSFAVFFTLVGIPIARRADRGNRVRIITWSLVLFSAMTGLCGMASTFWQLLLARIGVGIGESGTNPASQSMLTDIYPLERRSTALAFFALGPHLGIVLAFLAGGSLGELFGWRYAFLIAAAVGIAVATAARLLLIDPPRTTQADAITLGPALRALWVHRSMRHLFAAAAVTTIAAYALIGWLPAFLMRSHGLTLSTSGTVLALIIGVAGGIGAVLGGLLADHFGRRDPAWRVRVIALAWLVAAPLWTIVFSGAGNAATYTALVLAGGLIGFYVGPSFAMVQSLADPRMRAFAASLLLFAANLVGLGLGPLAVGVISDAGHDRLGADSLRVALWIVPPLYIWAAAHYHAAARTLARDLRGQDEAFPYALPGCTAPRTPERTRAHFR